MEKNIEELFNTLTKLGKLISQKTHETQEEKSATMLQFFALRLVSEKKNSTVSELGEALSLSKSSTTQLIERLEKSSLLKKITDNKDKRIIHLTITEEGIREFQTLRKKMIGKMTEVFSNLDESDLKTLIKIHTKLLKKVEAKEE